MPDDCSLTLEQGVRNLVDRFASGKTDQQLKRVCMINADVLAVVFCESVETVEAEIMSHLYVDPNQQSLPL